MSQIPVFSKESVSEKEEFEPKSILKKIIVPLSACMFNTALSLKMNRLSTAPLGRPAGFFCLFQQAGLKNGSQDNLADLKHEKQDTETESQSDT